MMVQHDFGYLFGPLDVPEDALANSGVLLDNLILLVGQGASLAQDVFRHANFSHIMQNSSQFKSMQRLIIQPHRFSDLQRISGYALGMAAGVVILGFDSGHECAHRATQQLMKLPGERHALHRYPGLFTNR